MIGLIVERSRVWCARYAGRFFVSAATGILMPLCLMLGQPSAVAADDIDTAETAQTPAQRVEALAEQLVELQQRLDTAIGPASQLVPPEQTATESFAGVWFDEMAGLGFAHARVELHRNGDAIHGEVYDVSTAQLVGVVLGAFQGTQFQYRYLARDGSTGRGQGMLRSDGAHIDLLVADDGYQGMPEVHLLHRDHLPSSPDQ